MRTLLLLIIFFLTTFVVDAQDRVKYIIAETGFNTYVSSPREENNYIRDDMSTLSYESGSASYFAKELNAFYTGLKLEVRSRNNKFGFIGGLRYTQLTSSIAKKGSPEYFYFLYQETTDNMEYLKIKSISEKSSFIGIPVEVRFFPFKVHSLFRPYITVGGEFAIPLSTDNSVEFYNSAMSSYESGVIDKVKSNNIRLGSGFAGIGISYGKPGKPCVNVGVSAPALLDSECSSLLTPIAGAGVRLQILIPLSKPVE